ncbi:hypothetical protein [Lysobacter enzymogenes]|uniref:TRAFAC clade GTPase domain-containing protein n=1 Tax=Lysobacter enzymogenes TaxID=69 RepID=UPI00089A2E43|nr:hypothetical protein [Lysobacter enzymogenes]SDX24536.1 hypothetical protein SAMN05421681_104348 [Lysobacter enzymogenes]
MSQSIVLLGGPDSGKTNYIGRLWRILDEAAGALHVAEQPEDLSFVLEIADHLFEGEFAPRTELSEARRDFNVVVAAESGGATTKLIVPDISGELWQTAVLESEIAADWMQELRNASGALLFVRVASDQDVRPLDWVTSRKMLELIGSDDDHGMPTQIMLCELLRFLECSLARQSNGGMSRLSIIVSAWDLVDSVTFTSGPVEYLKQEYPLFFGRLGDMSDIDVRVYGLSVVGGDLKNDLAYREQFLRNGLDGRGWVAVLVDGVWRKNPDVTLPLAWAMGL